MLWICALSPSAFAAVQPWTVPALLKTLSHTANHKVRFTQTNHIASLNRPIHMRGTLAYTPPDTLVMTQSAPRKAIYRIKGDRLYVNQAQQGVPVSRYPGVEAIASGFEGLLSGNHALLAHDFALTLSGNAQGWQLVLRPRLGALRRALTDVVVTGREGQFMKITTHAPNGDFSVMRIVP
ncbi:MAG: LolA-related protein [Acidiferrobacter sp.]